MQKLFFATRRLLFNTTHSQENMSYSQTVYASAFVQHVIWISSPPLASYRWWQRGFFLSQKVILSIFENHPCVFSLYHFSWVNRMCHGKRWQHKWSGERFLFLRTCKCRIYLFHVVTLPCRKKTETEKNLYRIMYYHYSIYNLSIPHRASIITSSTYDFEPPRWCRRLCRGMNVDLGCLWHAEKGAAQKIFIKNSIALLYYSWSIFKRDVKGAENYDEYIKNIPRSYAFERWTASAVSF